LLIGAIVVVVLVSTGRLRPTPVNRLQSDYLTALDNESTAVRQAKAAGHSVDTDTAVIQARADLTLLEIQAGDTSTALSRARGLAKGASQSARAHYVYGVALVATGQNRASLAQYQTALRLVKDADVELKRSILSAYGDVLVTLNRPAQAYSLIKQAAALPPASVDLYTQAAVLATKQGNFQDAATDYLSALTYDPQNSAATAGLRRLESAHPEVVKAVQQAQKEARP